MNNMQPGSKEAWQAAVAVADPTVCPKTGQAHRLVAEVTIDRELGHAYANRRYLDDAELPVDSVFCRDCDTKASEF